jgi:phosphate transport system substrate-binding protein
VAFREKYNDIKIYYKSIGSADGIRRFLAGEVDFASSSAPMLADEILQAERPIQLLPMTGGMVAVAYNLPGVDNGINLPRDVLVEAFLGKPLFWNDPRLVAVNPGVELPSLKIRPVVRGRGSGTTYVFTSYLQRTSLTWRESGLGAHRQIDWPGGAMAVKKNEGVAQRIQVTPGAIGYLQFGLARYVGLSVAALESDAGAFVFPSVESGNAALTGLKTLDLTRLKMTLPISTGAMDYPIVSLTWLMFYKEYDDPRKLQVLKDAVRWRVTEGQLMAEDMGYLPLPQALVSRILKEVDQL